MEHNRHHEHGQDGSCGSQEMNSGSRADGLLLAYYGDDFTGSTDVMEALTWNGVRTVLFLEPPTEELLASRFAGIQALGIAGISRSLPPDEMERELVPVFAALARFNSKIVHYKVCSTFDSSPTIGSIGRAMEIGAAAFDDQSVVPLLVGAPSLQRYTVFGQHFAAVGGMAYRLDRHPTMSSHPMTPMDEADLLRHLARQTNRSSALLNILDLEGDSKRLRERLQLRLAEQPGVLLFDVLDQPRLQAAGQLIWELAEQGNRFVVGSSGIEYALAAHWQQQGIVKHGKQPQRQASGGGRASAMLAVSGSCSPVTEAQIRYALDHGFTGIQANVPRLLHPDTAAAERGALLARAESVAAEGGIPLVYTALGSADEQIGLARQQLEQAGLSASDTGRLIGQQLGRLAREFAERHSLPRLLVAGGDTSGYVMRELGIYALEALQPLAPGGPLCVCYAESPQFDGLQLVLKGGQVGQEDFFLRVLQGQ
ncbi:four-carbon acid sugar kinase family protein [Paenibacillus sp. SYP-B4298]|uniref:four-carbon acid sugar kinase family protein n=1 Tax=Paenibacillus sp. SYP-B4298 TaxID=2996034 RepID=UPI0022DD569C|nr:four-carbon acid sugar kinase family protein [Paenibacillus sp. SYP-B4298]